MLIRPDISVTRAQGDGEIATSADTMTNREMRFSLQFEELGFQTVNQEDADVEKGQSQTRQAGKKGIRFVIYKYQFENDKQVEKSLFFWLNLIKPINQVVALGTREPQVITSSSNVASYEQSSSQSAQSTDGASQAAAQREAEIQAYNERQAANAQAGLQALGLPTR